MRGDRLIHFQLLLAQAFDAIALTLTNANGFSFTPISYAGLPQTPTAGMMMCINDSATTSGVAQPGGFNTVMVFYTGTDWKVM